MNILDMYTGTAAARGADPAISFEMSPFAGVTLSWSDLLDRADACAEELTSTGIGEGSRVATYLVDHPNALPALLGMWKLGAVPVMIDPEWGESIRSGVLSHSRADAVVTIGERLGAESVAAAADRPPLPPGTAMVAYTSGSTSAPKGIPLRHDRLVAGLHASAGKISGFRGDRPARFGSSMRLSGFGVLALHFLWSAAFGAEVVVLPRLDLASAGGYWADVERHQIDQVVLVPALYELLLRASRPGEHSRRPLFVNASGPISATTHQRFMDRFGAVVLNCYGLTETTWACMVGDTDVRGLTTQAVGRPDLVFIQLRGADGSVVEGEGEGEIEVRGPTVSDGYYDNAEDNAALFDGPWIRTGDLGRRDETGKFWIAGRLKDAVMKGGTTVYLTDIEEACIALDGVLEAVAVRADLPGGIEDIGVIVRPVAGADAVAADLKAALDRELGSSRSPRSVIVTERELPRIGQNKIDRRSAKELWTELGGRG